MARFSCTLLRQTYLPRRGLFSWSSFSMSPVSTVEDFEVEHKGSDSKLGKVEAEESYENPHCHEQNRLESAALTSNYVNAFLFTLQPGGRVLG